MSFIIVWSRMSPPSTVVTDVVVNKAFATDIASPTGNPERADSSEEMSPRWLCCGQYRLARAVRISMVERSERQSWNSATALESPETITTPEALLTAPLGAHLLSAAPRFCATPQATAPPSASIAL